jgi:hypothetical protein
LLEEAIKRRQLNAGELRENLVSESLEGVKKEGPDNRSGLFTRGALENKVQQQRY